MGSLGLAGGQRQPGHSLAVVAGQQIRPTDPQRARGIDVQSGHRGLQWQGPIDLAVAPAGQAALPAHPDLAAGGGPDREHGPGGQAVRLIVDAFLAVLPAGQPQHAAGPQGAIGRLGDGVHPAVAQRGRTERGAERPVGELGQPAAAGADPQAAFSILQQRADVVLGQPVGAGEGGDTAAGLIPNQTGARGHPDVSVAIFQHAGGVRAPQAFAGTQHHAGRSVQPHQPTGGGDPAMAGRRLEQRRDRTRAEARGIGLRRHVGTMGQPQARPRADPQVVCSAAPAPSAESIPTGVAGGPASGACRRSGRCRTWCPARRRRRRAEWSARGCRAAAPGPGESSDRTRRRAGKRARRDRGSATTARRDRPTVAPRRPPARRRARRAAVADHRRRGGPARPASRSTGNRRESGPARAPRPRAARR